MVIVENNKRKKKFKMPDMPNFGNRRRSVAWLLNQRKKARLLNVKSVSVQVKDIKMMIYTKKPRLVGLYSKMSFKNALSNEEEYITIHKTSDLNKSLMYEIIEADWLVNKSELDEMSTEEIEAKCRSTECQLQILKGNKAKYSHLKLDDRIKLVEYKLNSMNEYLISRKKDKVKSK